MSTHSTARELADVVGIETVVAMDLATMDAGTGQPMFSDDSELEVEEDLMTIFSELMNVQSQRRLVQQQAERIADRVHRVSEAVGNWMHVNSTGELQSSGPAFDVACAIYETSCTNLVRACRQYAKRHQAAAATS
jgi:predicted RecB family endonuclease